MPYTESGTPRWRKRFTVNHCLSLSGMTKLSVPASSLATNSLPHSLLNQARPRTLNAGSSGLTTKSP
ncbi:Uncharacterised protein [Vibrio cholerae]|uniref:Uncharacterized protein n=1 Tax=Vibrio cholerae TaxID=666 RepID=A0A655Q0T1_VIBCL|nr:Uncharacterised protein [Vibrio cholerae]CSA36550.1 Uncharacterised protein [Vibrio cholerae]CSA52096.1 Uncharacterised protein [Vibrio cholerae]